APEAGGEARPRRRYGAGVRPSLAFRAPPQRLLQAEPGLAAPVGARRLERPEAAPREGEGQLPAPPIRAPALLQDIESHGLDGGDGRSGPAARRGVGRPRFTGAASSFARKLEPCEFCFGARLIAATRQVG